MLGLLLTLLTFSVKSEKFPGIKTSMSISSFEYQIHQELPFLLRNVAKIDIPDTYFWVAPYLVPSRLEVSNFYIHHLTLIPENSFLTSDPSSSTLSLNLQGLDMDISGDYTYVFPFKAGGYFNMTFTNSSLVIPIKIGVTESHEVSMKVENIVFKHQSLSVEVTKTESSSSIFAKIHEYIPEEYLKNHVVKSIFKSIPDHINKALKTYLKEYKYVNRIGQLDVSSDYEVYSLEMDKENIVLKLNGTCFLNKNPKFHTPIKAPWHSPNFTLPSPFKVQLTEYFFENFLWAMYISQSFRVYINGSSIPENFPYQFTTTGFNKFAPEMTTVFGRNKRVDMECEIYSLPQLSINKSVNVKAEVNCNFLVAMNHKETVIAFTVLMDLKTMVSSFLVYKESEIYAILALDRTAATFDGLKVINSKVGIVSISKLTSAFNWYGYYLINAANSLLLNDGILLPFPKRISYKNEKFSLSPGALEIGFDPVFHN